MSRSKILFLMSGSIAAFKACQVISQLVQDGHEVQVATTASLRNFIGAGTLEGLTGHKVLEENFEPGHMMDHIRLSRWADIGVLCPATANMIAKASLGLADDLVSALILAWPKTTPLFIFPAMNSEMWSAPTTLEHVNRLRKRGFYVAETGAGTLACGEVGFGRLLEADEILNILTSPPKMSGKILITAGATREPLDGIRFLSNVSTGQTGSVLADLLTAQGWSVTYLGGQGSLQPRSAAHKISFSSFSDLESKLRSELGAKDYSAVIHCAAVSDYSPAKLTSSGGDIPRPEDIKIPSDQDLVVHLKRNHKILPLLKEYSRNKKVKVVGFKLTLNSDESETRSAVDKLWSESVDAVVANDWTQVAADRQRHPGTFLTRQDEPKSFQSLSELGNLLHQFIEVGAPI